MKHLIFREERHVCTAVLVLKTCLEFMSFAEIDFLLRCKCYSNSCHGSGRNSFS